MQKFIIFLTAFALAVAGSTSRTPRTAQSAGYAGYGSGLNVHFQGNTNELRIAVTPPEYDDMGIILTTMGWNYTDISSRDLTFYDILSQYDAIFINCSSEIATYANMPAFGSEEIRANLERFVREGGTLYASDWAFEYIDKSFPGYIHYFEHPFPELGDDSQSVIANIVDPGLASFMDSPTVEILFNAPSWVPIDSVADG